MGGENPVLEAPIEKQRVVQAVELISSLISNSFAIRIFPSRWQNIRSKLEELFSILTTVENSASDEEFSLSVTIESILVTLDGCRDLSQRCLRFSYSGKLHMQSDLEILYAKLDCHIKTLSDVYARGLLTQAYAIVVSKPGLLASKEQIMFYVNDLLSRIKIGSPGMKKLALLEFNAAGREDDRFVKVAVEIDSFVNSLVRFLDHEESEIREEAVKAVSLITDLYPCKSALIGAGVIGPLIRVLESGNAPSKELSARCLLKVTENSDHAWSVSAHGGVTALLKMCAEKGENGGELVNSSCGVLRNLVSVQEIRSFMVEEGAVSLFIKLSRSQDERIQISSLDLLQTMAYTDSSIRETIVRAGGISRMVRILDPKSSFSMKTREMAFKGIMNLCISSENSLTVLMNSSFTDHLLHFLRFGESSIRELALKASFWLSRTGEDAKKVMGDSGFMPVLVNFLESKSFHIREMAAETLSSMVIIPKNRKRFVQNDKNVGIVMQLLDPGEANSGSKKLLLSMLMSLTSSNRARKMISNSGHLKNIEKLAEAEVSDAKKIVRKITPNRLQSILSGFWHS